MLAPMSGESSHKAWKIVAIVAAVVVVLVVAIPFAYIHFFSGSTPAKLSISNTGSSGTSTTLGAATAPLDGTWTVTSGSQAGYRVNEVLFGQSTTAVGRTSSVTGQLVIAGDQMSSASFTVDMTTVHSDKSQRDEQFQGRIMQTSQFPHATFATTAPITLSPVPTNGQTIQVSAMGNLTLHGVTKAVTVPLTTRRSGNVIQVSGSIPVIFADYDIANPSAAGLVTTEDHGTVEFLLVFKPEAG
jgi:polyisoprenoid-binding protein YceI